MSACAASAAPMMMQCQESSNPLPCFRGVFAYLRDSLILGAGQEKPLAATVKTKPISRHALSTTNSQTFIVLIALFAHMCQGQGLDWIVWMGWLESKGLELCARGKAWMTRAGDHGRKGCLSLSHGREGWLGLSHGRVGWPGLNIGRKRHSVRLE